MAASSIPAIEAGDLTIRECVSTIHSPARAIGELRTQHSRPVTTWNKIDCMDLMTALLGPAQFVAGLTEDDLVWPVHSCGDTETA